jgi:hypothetical protein
MHIHQVYIYILDKGNNAALNEAKSSCISIKYIYIF